MNNGEFQWTPAAINAFREVKKLMTEAPVMRLLDFSKVFKVTCDCDRWCAESRKTSRYLF